MDEPTPADAPAGQPVATSAITAAPAPEFPVGWPEYRATAALLLCFVASLLLAVLFASPFKAAGLEVFEDPEDAGNSLWYIVFLVAFTFLLLYIAKKGKKWLIRLIILAAVGSTIGYVVFPLLLQAGVVDRVSLGLAAVAAVGSVWALHRHPEWYVIDTVGLLVAGASAALLGISLGIVPVIVLLAGLAVYDFIAVYRTRHMLSLADTVIELRLPVLLVIPKHLPYRFRAEATRLKQASEADKGEREAMFLGLGDLVMPAILVVSALHFAQPGWGLQPALGAAVGTLVGFGVLMGFVLKGRPQAGLPLLNGGAIVGFLSGVHAATGSVAFW